MLKILTLTNVKYAECSKKCKKINKETIGAKDKNRSSEVSVDNSKSFQICALKKKKKQFTYPSAEQNYKLIIYLLLLGKMSAT